MSDEATTRSVSLTTNGRPEGPFGEHNGNLDLYREYTLFAVLFCAGHVAAADTHGIGRHLPGQLFLLSTRADDDGCVLEYVLYCTQRFSTVSHSSFTTWQNLRLRNARCRGVGSTPAVVADPVGYTESRRVFI